MADDSLLEHLARLSGIKPEAAPAPTEPPPQPPEAPPAPPTTSGPKRPARRGSENRKKALMVTSRYDEAEFAELEAAASRAGLTRASFQRVQSLAAPKTRSTRRAPIERETLAKVLAQLGKVGSNLNQLTHAAHLGFVEKAEIDAELAYLRKLGPVILEALGRKR
jgi:hypothetical protein